MRIQEIGMGMVISGTEVNDIEHKLYNNAVV